MATMKGEDIKAHDVGMTTRLIYGGLGYKVINSGYLIGYLNGLIEGIYIGESKGKETGNIESAAYQHILEKITEAMKTPEESHKEKEK